MGCGYFSSDRSFLPDLKAHLDELVRSREHGVALGAEAWALAPGEEIQRLRTLIARLESDLTQLPDDRSSSAASRSASGCRAPAAKDSLGDEMAIRVQRRGRTRVAEPGRHRSHVDHASISRVAT